MVLVPTALGVAGYATEVCYISFVSMRKLRTDHLSIIGKIQLPREEKRRSGLRVLERTGGMGQGDDLHICRGMTRDRRAWNTKTILNEQHYGIYVTKPNA